MNEPLALPRLPFVLAFAGRNVDPEGVRLGGPAVARGIAGGGSVVFRRSGIGLGSRAHQRLEPGLRVVRRPVGGPLRRARTP